MPQPIYLLVGVPGTGKSWVCDQLQDQYEVVRHDDFINGGHIAAIMQAADGARPVLTETPFSMSRIIEPLTEAGYAVIPVFVIEDEELLERCWDSRGTPFSVRKGHMTRQNTYMDRAKSSGAFCGDSVTVLNYLKIA